ncbi:MAG: carboxypeptidase-like regulatory domain-containing protein [Nonlabens sp.]
MSFKRDRKMHFKRSYGIFLLLFGLLTVAVNAQATRSQISGIIKNAIDEPISGITVFNNNSMEGTVTNDAGLFYMNVAVGDRLSLQAIQYERFTLVVTATTIENKEISLNLVQGVNVLDEVILNNDLMKIEVKPDKDYNEPFSKLDKKKVRIAPSDRKENIFSDRIRAPSEYQIRHSAFSQNIPRISMFNFLGVANSLLVNGSLEKVDLSIDRKSNKKRVEKLLLKNKFNKNDLIEFFNIPEDQLVEFMYFAQESGLTAEMLQPENEFETLQFLTRQSQLFRKRKKLGTTIDQPIKK